MRGTGEAFGSQREETSRPADAGTRGTGGASGLQSSGVDRKRRADHWRLGRLCAAGLILNAEWGGSALACHRIQRCIPHGATTSMSSCTFQLDELDVHILPLQHRRFVLAPALSPANSGRSPICLPVLRLATLLAPARDADHSRLLRILLLPVITPLPVLLISLLVLIIILLISVPLTVKSG